jgi:hypothetical protein
MSKHHKRIGLDRRGFEKSGSQRRKRLDARINKKVRSFLDELYQKYTTPKITTTENKFGNYFFRGQSDFAYGLLPSAYRDDNYTSEFSSAEESDLYNFINDHYRNGYKGDKEFNDNLIYTHLNIRQPDEKTLYFMHLAQHYAFDHKSRYRSSLLDVTLDIKMALLFAIINSKFKIDDTKDGALFIFTREEIEKNTDHIKFYNLFNNKYRITNGTTRLQIQNGAFLYREQTGIGFNTKPFKLGEKIKIPKEFKKDLFNTLQPELFKQMLYAPQILNAPETSIQPLTGEGWEEYNRQELRKQTSINQKIGLHRSDQYIC